MPRNSFNLANLLFYTSRFRVELDHLPNNPYNTRLQLEGRGRVDPFELPVFVVEQRIHRGGTSLS